MSSRRSVVREVSALVARVVLGAMLAALLLPALLRHGLITGPGGALVLVAAAVAGVLAVGSAYRRLRRA